MLPPTLHMDETINDIDFLSVNSHGQHMELCPKIPEEGLFAVGP